MNILAAWWAWLGRVQVVIRWPTASGCDDWTDEQRGAIRR